MKIWINCLVYLQGNLDRSLQQPAMPSFKIGDIRTPTTKLSDFKPFMPAPREATTLPTKVQEAIEKNNEKLQSKITLTNHRRQASLPSVWSSSDSWPFLSCPA
ncbi:uncharacterized protein, partial [Haliotis cracherodii]|uniref:uncharacterized protein n=1 Tax=Haliotis cracherodii TaxID=6455 RepID=UPI0039E82AEA